MNNNQVGHNCRHCRKRLPFNATATICRRCRFNGHREFGDCLKCAPDIRVANLRLFDKFSNSGKLP